MKKNAHPKYQQVLFVDSSTGYKFICGSTAQPEEKGTHEGVEYPMYRASISSASHPFFTGSKQLLDAEGRVDKFKKKYEAAKARANKDSSEEGGEEPKEELKEKAKKAPSAKKSVKAK